MAPSPSDREDAVDVSLADATAALVRSAHTSRAVDQVLARQHETLTAADETIQLTRRILGQVDVDIASMERRHEQEVRRQARVLVVDDNRSIRDVLRILLELECGEGAQVRTVDDGFQALAEAAWAPHVIILDWQMPDLDGPETARRLRAELGDATRIVMYSSLTAAEAEEAALQAGADVYIEKGPDTSVLVDEVQSAIAGCERRRQLQR